MFLQKKDFYTAISQRNFDNLLIEFDDKEKRLADIVDMSVAEMEFYLAGKYDIDKIFRNFTLFAISKAYIAGDYVLYAEPAYKPSQNYVVNDRVEYGGQIFQCISPTTGVFEPLKWTFVIESNQFFKAIADTTNEYPETEYWELSDPRHKLIVRYCIDIACYLLCKASDKKVIPMQYAQAYDGNGDEKIMSAIKWLKMVMAGKYTTDLPLIEPPNELGNDIIFGSETQIPIKAW